MTGRGNRRVMIRAGRLWDDREWYSTVWLWGEDGDGRTRWRVDRVQGGKLRTSYLEICAPWVYAIKFLESISRLTPACFLLSYSSSRFRGLNLPQTNHHGEITSPGMLGCSRAGLEKKFLHQRRMDSSPLRFSRAMYGPDLHRVCTGSLICGRPAGASSRLWLVDVN
jgi:hypothetical protein